MKFQLNFAVLSAIWCSFLFPSIALGQENNQDKTAKESQKFTTVLAENQESQPITLESFSWLEGCWEGSGLGGECTELWSGSKGGVIVGSFRYVNQDKVQFTEHFTLKQNGKSVVLLLKHFDSDLKGWEEKDVCKEFKFVKREGDNFYFDGLTYTRNGKDGMNVYVVIHDKDGSSDEAKFEFRRTR